VFHWCCSQYVSRFNLILFAAWQQQLGESATCALRTISSIERSYLSCDLWQEGHSAVLQPGRNGNQGKKSR
jgi:hypothetical protein